MSATTVDQVLRPAEEEDVPSGPIWLWRDSGDSERVAQLAASTFWFVLPSLPMFLVLQWLLRSGLGFWTSIAISVAGTLALYALWFWAAPRLGIRL